MTESSISETVIDSLDFFVGEKWFFRTVTYHIIGRVTHRIGNILLLEAASWVADSGRFANAIKEGTLSEVEPIGKAGVNLSHVTDFSRGFMNYLQNRYKRFL